ncbi:reticulocyte binding protein 2-like protein b-like [Hibiscus syriacus]|uniref:Reticulocyte binding protein 2-like protein b-like n=1 Tax=Hibiscus syriacus TaxID=106335 RepID=A0A6A2Y4G0_HIBSY|nr:reticulocyte binding protein 2-like protein b-like [Hibiscus syriacus]
MSTEKLGIKVETNPPESKLSQLGLKRDVYLLEGKVKVYPDGSNDFVEIGAGDLVEFPKGMSCNWDVSAAVDKHYRFE